MLPHAPPCFQASFGQELSITAHIHLLSFPFLFDSSNVSVSVPGLKLLRLLASIRLTPSQRRSISQVYVIQPASEGPFSSRP